MFEFRNLEQELLLFRGRLLFASFIVLSIFFILFTRLFYLQIYKYNNFSAQAEGNRTSIVPIIPNRGLILDRNRIVLATNYSAYTLEVTPSKIINLDETLDALSLVIDISTRDKKRFRRLLEDSKSFESLPLRTRLTDEEVARFSAQHFRFPGVEIKARLFRQYPYGETASHIIGYIGRINQTEKETINDSEDAANYRGTEYIGKLGVEQSYEKELHGLTGVEEVETSARGRAVRKLNSDTATPGKTVILTIDIKLQKLIEDLFGSRRGALVAINPQNGEILAFVSKPTFDPNLFVEGIDSENWALLSQSLEKPLLNRALRGTYPPGSTYKPFMALAALELNKRSATTVINDPGYWMFGDHRFRSHGDGGLGSVDMIRSIVKSSNVYFYSLANELGVDAMHDFMKPLGFGQITGIDISGEVRGVLPSTDWKRKTYKKPEQRKWYPGETISLGIGQGYNSFTMLQLASSTATLSNAGLHFQPHLVQGLQDPITKLLSRPFIPASSHLGYKPEHISVITKGMIAVTTEGTSSRVFAGADYVSAGKTGTAQAVTIGQKDKYDARKVEEHQRDHALYIAFAPAEKPTLALAIIVENAGFGAEHAAPIARRVFDYHLLGRFPSSEDMQATQVGKSSSPIGKPILMR